MELDVTSSPSIHEVYIPMFHLCDPLPYVQRQLCLSHGMHLNLRRVCFYDYGFLGRSAIELEAGGTIEIFVLMYCSVSQPKVYIVTYTPVG
jgi:hypothetical protein